MSYILDALRKADAQRERDSSRGIHAHPTPPGVGANNGPRPVWLWGGIGALVVVVAASAWYMSKGKPPAGPVLTAQPSIPKPPKLQADAAPAVMPAPPPPPPVVAGVPPVTGARVITPPSRPRTEMPMPQMGGMAPRPSPPPPVQTAVQAPVQAPPAQATVPSAVAGLPPDAPRVAISGGVFSPNPAQRMLIVGGQVFNEGSEIAPGLTIDEIKPRTAVLKFRGARYTVSY
jgi:general secretion pathway protein B